MDRKPEAAESRDRKRNKEWRAEREKARREKAVARGEFAGRRIERAKKF